MSKKDVPADNPGLGKLPTEVRNRMGYKQKGGKVTANSMGRGVSLSNGGRIVYKANGYPIAEDDPALRKDETFSYNTEHSKKTDDANKKEIEKAGKYGDGVFMKGNHINYMDDDDY